MVDKFTFIKDRWSWEPHLSQKEFMACDAKTKVAACGRRWGKSEACAYDIAYYFLTKKDFSQMIISPTYDQSRLIFNVVEKLLSDIKGLKVKSSPYPIITYKNNIITGRSCDNDKGLRGYKAHRIVVDEAAFIPDSVIYEVIGPMLADYDGDLILISTPFGKNHFYDYYLKGLERSKNFASFSYKSLDNPFISKEYIERQRENISQTRFETEYEAKFCDNVSNVFKTDSILNCIEKDLNIKGKIIMGVDFARYGDYTVIIVLESDGYKAKVIDLIRFNKLTWEKEINIIVNTIKEYNPVSVICDATGAGDPLCEELDKKSSNIIKFKFTNESKNNIINYLNMLLDSGKISLPKNEILIEELRNFQYSFTESGNIKLEAKYNCHDDTVCALALATYGMKELNIGGIYSF